MRIKRLVCSALLCCILAPLCAGCGILVLNRTGSGTSPFPELPTVPPPEETSALPEPTRPVIPAEKVFTDRVDEAKQRLETIFTLDLTGFDLMAAVADGTPDTISPGEEEPSYAARSERNRMTAEKLHCGFYSFSAPVSGMKEELKVSVKSGTDAAYYADVLLLPAHEAAAFYTEGLILDLRRLPFYEVKTEKNDGFAGVGTRGKSSWFDTSTVVDDYEGICAVYFDRSAVGEAQTRALYEAALSGSFGWESFFMAVTNLGAAHPDRAALSFGGNADAAGGSAEALSELAAVSLGIRFVDASGDKPMLALTEEKAALLDDLLTRLAAVKIRSCADAAQSVFAASGSIFHIGPLAEMTSPALSSVSWGLLPLPSAADAPVALRRSAPVLAVTANNTRTEQTGLTLTALDAASGVWLRDRYLKTAAEKYLRDNASIRVLEQILAREGFRDAAPLWAPLCEHLAGATYEAVHTAFTSEPPLWELIAPFREAAQTELQKIYK